MIFGYQYGYKPGPQLNPAKIKLVKLFLGGKSAKARSFTFSDVLANGPSGEKPPVNAAPAGDKAERMRTLYAAREPLYRAAAHIVFSNHMPPLAAAQLLAQQLRAQGLA